MRERRKRTTISQRRIVSALLLASASWAAAQDLRMQMFDRAGTITFNAISNATEYTVVEKSGGDWTALATIPNTGSEVVTATVSMVDADNVYRIEASLASSGPEGFALITGGSFLMGSTVGEVGRNADEIQHEVTLTRDFYLQKTEVTNRQMADVLNWALSQGTVSASTSTVTNLEGTQQELLDLDSSGSQISWNGSQLVVDAGKDDYPCLEVTWYGAQAYCNYLSDMEGLTRAVDFSERYWGWSLEASGYRLPTESEWEYACRAETTTAFYTGGITATGCSFEPNLDVAGWYCDNAGGGSHPVGLKQANAWDLYDMHGNVSEWCADWYGTYPGSVTDPTGQPVGPYRVWRGGSWNSFQQFCRSAHRDGYLPTRSYNNVGFRPARSVVP